MQVVIVTRAFTPLLPPPRCECCGSLEEVAMEPSRTRYSRDPTPWEERAARKRYRALIAALALGGQQALNDMGAPHFSPKAWSENDFVLLCSRDDEVANRDLSLCRGCAADHHAEWDERWSEYYSELL